MAISDTHTGRQAGGAGARAQSRLLLVGEKPIREGKLGEQLYRYLRDLIDSGKVERGARLPTEKQFGETFRMSRPVVREALARLRMEGLITSRRGSGSYVNVAREQPAGKVPPLEVTSLTESRPSRSTNLLRHFELRMAVECDAAYYASLRREPQHLAAMSAAMAEMDAALRLKSLDHDAHFRFHLAIADATDNIFFVNTLLTLRPYLEVSMNLFRDLWLINPGEEVNSGTHDHAHIWQAIKDGEPDRAHRAMRLHIDEARRELFGNLADPWPTLASADR